MKKTATQGGSEKKTERKWLEKAETLKIDELSGFADGIKREIDTVKNAIRFDYIMGWQREAFSFHFVFI